LLSNGEFSLDKRGGQFIFLECGSAPQSASSDGWGCRQLRKDADDLSNRDVYVDKEKNMWSFVLLGLVVLIFVLSILKVSQDVKRKKSGRLIVKESFSLLAVIILLAIVDIRCAKEKEAKQEGKEEVAGEQATTEESREADLLAQLQDYLGVLTDSDKPQLKYYLEDGQEQSRKKEYAEAVDVFEQALELNISDEERFPFFILLGNGEAHLGEYTAAINYYYQAEGICKGIGDDTALVVVYSNLALVHRLADEPKGALGMYFNLLQLFRKLGDSLGEKNTLANIGFMYQTQGEADSASYYHRKSLEIPGSEAGLLAEAAQMNNLALTYSSRGMPDSALALYQQALTLFRQAGDRREEASVLVNMGLIYQEKKDLQEAVGYYQSAFSIDSALGSVRGQAGDLTNLGSVSEQEGDLAKAKEFYQRALSLFEQVDAKNEVEFVRQNIRRVESKSGE
jgi:tetratricopeptide (TPR) repeat protein